jgi:ankyrin repeat protein
MVKMLIELGASLGPMSDESRSRTPLHLAVCCRDSEICKCLLSKGADPSLRDSEGRSPLDLAVAICALGRLRSILESDSSLRIALRGNIIADVVRSLDSRYSTGIREHLARRVTRSWYSQTQQPSYTALQTFDALQSACTDNIVEHLVSGVPPSDPRETKANEAIDIVRTLLVRGCDINAGTSTSLDTPLHIACDHSRSSLVKFLVGEGADVHRPNKAGDTALLAAFSSSTSSGVDIRIVETLVQAGADVNLAESEYM